ncbi:MAG TPA: VOC family protein [Gemmatimonadales bacterium]|nr:VOC family protein [Gemmatimonadales bacterium]
MIKALKFVGVPVSDQDKALEFYTTKLGFRVITDQPMGPGQRWIEIGLRKGGTGIALFTPKGQEDRIGTFTGISFVADDVKGTWKELTANGVKFIREPEVQEWGTSSIFADQDGNQFVLGSP